MKWFCERPDQIGKYLRHSESQRQIQPVLMTTYDFSFSYEEKRHVYYT